MIPSFTQMAQAILDGKTTVPLIREGFRHRDTLEWLACKENREVTTPFWQDVGMPPPPWPESNDPRIADVVRILMFGQLPGDELARLDVETGAYQRFLGNGPLHTVVDAGAHVGWFTLRMALRSERVIAFEASQRNATILAAAASASLYPDKIKVHPKALGQKAGVAKFYANASTVRGSLYGTGFSMDVEVMALDDLQLQHVSFLKVDVEGSELDVLMGAEQTIAGSRPRIALDMENRQQEAAHLLQRHGYRILSARRMEDDPREGWQHGGMWWAEPL